MQEIDDYINQFNEEIKEKLSKIRSTIKEVAVGAEEKISWKMPTFYLTENLIHFAAMKNHIGIYPGPEVIEVFKEKLEKYKTSKGAICFSHNKEIDYDLLREIVEFRMLSVSKKINKNENNRIEGE